MNGIVPEGLEGTVLARPEGDGLHRLGPVGEAPHLLTGQDDPHRAVQVPGGQHRQEGLELRTQARAEAATEIGVEHPHLLRLQAEGAGEVLLRVRDTLHLVVDGVVAVRLDHDGRGVGLHRVMVLVGHPVLLAQLDGRLVEGSVRITPRLRRRLDAVALLGRVVGLADQGVDVGPGRLRLVADLHHGGGHAGGRHRVLVDLRVLGHVRTVLVGEHLDHAGHRFGRGGIDPRNRAPGDGAGDDVAVGEARRRELGGVLGEAGDLRGAVDAAAGAADVTVGAGGGADLNGHRDLTGCACR